MKEKPRIKVKFNWKTGMVVYRVDHLTYSHYLSPEIVRYLAERYREPVKVPDGVTVH